MARNQKLTLKEWIDSKGTAHVANLLEVAESTVRHWHRGHCLPNDRQKHAIVRASNGAVTYDTMIETHFAANAGKEGI